MNRIRKALDNKKSFIGFITAGDPNIETTEEIILKMVDAGVDLVEIGIPFSDPNAEGEVIQDANIRALKVGTTIQKIFKMVKNVREKTGIPLVFMSYMNPIFYYGYDDFFEKCEEVGIDGVIIVDLPYEEKAEVEVFSSKYGVELVPLVAPTSKDRIPKIVKDANGFIYLVSSLGVTGTRDEIDREVGNMVKDIKKHTDTPVAVGFGLNTPEQVRDILEVSDGVIVGSAIVKVIEEHGEEAPERVYDFIKDLRKYI